MITLAKEKINMQLKLQRLPSFLITIAILLFASSIVLAQEDTTPKKRLRSPATVRGFVGGESHDSYVIRVSKGKTMTVQISWRREGDNHAEFTISRSSSFFNGNPVKFGKETNNGKRWVGRIPKTGNYYLYVVANPTAHYKLKVTVR